MVPFRGPRKLSAGGGGGGTAFDPDYTPDTGKAKIVSLVLPETAASIKAGDPFESYFTTFPALESVTGADVFFDTDSRPLTITLPRTAPSAADTGADSPGTFIKNLSVNLTVTDLYRATALTFFGVKIPLQAVFFEEKIHR